MSKLKKSRMPRGGAVRRRPKSINKYGKARVNIMVPAELYFWIQGYVEENRTSVTKIIVDHFSSIREAWVSEHTAEQI